MSPKKQAIEDIKQELQKSSLCFIAFHTELNPRMRKIVKDYTREQKLYSNTIKKKGK